MTRRIKDTKSVGHPRRYASFYQAGQNKRLSMENHFSLSIAPQRSGKELYIDAKPIAELLGGQWQAENGIAVVSTSGSFRSFSETWEFDGSPSVIHGVAFQHVSFYSVYDIAAAFGAAVHVVKNETWSK
ncbi:hypothetical protein DI43_18720 [Geobacillus sp. CAMR12739]|nr:hypothetical protein DI43_18720 [Geobacillus sp. CAMR12739]